MIQCVSDSNPYDDEPDVIEEAENWLKTYSDECDHDLQRCSQAHARSVIEMLLAYIKEEI